MSGEESDRYRKAERAFPRFLRKPSQGTFDELERLRPFLDPAWFFWAAGERYRMAGEFEPAATSFRESLRRDPNSPLARAAYVHLLTDGGARTKALAELAREWPMLERPRLYLGFALLESKQFPQAVEALRRSAELLPEDSWAWANLTLALLATRDQAGAREAAEHYLGLSTGSFAMDLSAARLLFQAGWRRKAFGVAWRAVRRAPGPRSILATLTLPFQLSTRRTRQAALAGFVLLIAGLLFSSGIVGWICLASGGFILGMFEVAAHVGGAVKIGRSWLRFQPLRQRLAAEGRTGSADGVPPVLAGIPPPSPPRRRVRRAFAWALVAIGVAALLLLRTAVKQSSFQLRAPSGLSGLGSIAFAGGSEGKSTRIFLMDADGTNVHPFTSPPPGMVDSEPALAADGSKIAFVRAPGGVSGNEDRGDVWTANVDGGSPTQLTTGVPSEYPAWSPDGTHIAYDAERGITHGSFTLEITEIYTMGVDGSAQTRLTVCDPQTCFGDYSPTWSQDGRRIAFVRGFAQPGQSLFSLPSYAVVLMNADGTGLSAVGCHLPDCHGHDSDPAWSPDGSKLAFIRDGEVAIADADGSNVKPLTPCLSIVGCGVASDPAWSGGGSDIVFAGAYATYSRLWVTGKDGRDLFPLTPSREDACCPSWSWKASAPG